MQNNSTNNAIITYAINSIINNFIVPSLKTVFSNIDINIRKNRNLYTDLFKVYLETEYKKNSILTTLALRKDTRKLSSLYVPLEIVLQDNDDRKYIIDTYSPNLIPFFKKVLITDYAGMGKSTIVKKLFISVIETKQGIPILIELRKLDKEKRIIDEIIDQLSKNGDNFSLDLFNSLLKDGHFVFFLDGYDEISLECKSHVTKDIQKFISNSIGNKFVLTSRPDLALRSFNDFTSFYIRPLEKHEAYNLLKNYDENGVTSYNLIKEIENVMDSVEEFITNPLLVSLLFVAYNYSNKIPFKKHIFYRQVFDALFELHDLSKNGAYKREMYCKKLQSDDYHKVLRHIASNCIRNNQFELNKDKIIHYINEAKHFHKEIDFETDNFLKDITSSAPILINEGIYYKWAHKSIQEYFCAQFLYLDTKDSQSKILVKISNSDNIISYENTLDIYKSIDPVGFKSTILYSFIKQYLNYFEHSKIYYGIKEDDIKMRKSFLFFSEVHLFITDSNAFDTKTKNRCIADMEYTYNNLYSDDSTLFNKLQVINHDQHIIYSVLHKFKSTSILFNLVKSYLFEADVLINLTNDDQKELICFSDILSDNLYKIDIFTNSSLDSEVNYRKLNSLLTQVIERKHEINRTKLRNLQSTIETNNINNTNDLLNGWG